MLDSTLIGSCAICSSVSRSQKSPEAGWPKVEIPDGFPLSLLRIGSCLMPSSESGMHGGELYLDLDDHNIANA